MSRFGSRFQAPTTSWRWRANCRTAELSDFFDDGFDDIAVVDYCRPCPVRLRCVIEELEVAPKVSNQEGVRGLTAGDRKRLIRWLRASDLEPHQVTLANIERYDRDLSSQATGVGS